MRWRLYAALTIIIGCAHAADAAASPTIALSSCKVADMERTARCGSLDVPENPAQPDGRRIAIHVAVVPASGAPARPDPIAVLMGGPGEEAISAAGVFTRLLAPLLVDRDLLLVDQRGTGRSGGLRCDLSSADDPAANLRDFLPLGAVERCEQQLREQADLTQYTYTHFANDLEQVRRALGYERLNVFAGSYGTRAAQVFVRAYPQSVRTVLLHSVVPIDVTTPLTFAKAAQTAFEKTFDACAADSACHQAFPNLRDEFRQVLARLDAGVNVTVPGVNGAVPLHRGRVVEWLRAVLYRAEGAATAPWLIHQAYTGNWTPIVDGILAYARSRGRQADVSFGLFLTITCNDDVAFLREKDIEPQTRGTFLRDYRVRQQQAACKNWPKITHAADFRQPVRSSVPTMFISGDIDPAAPLWFTEHTARGFTNRVELVQRNQGHTEWNECAVRVYERFVKSGATQGLDTSCPPLPRPPFLIGAGPGNRDN